MTVEYDGVRYGAHRFRLNDRERWDETVSWMDANGVECTDESTIFYTMIAIRDDEQATLFRSRWEGTT